MTLLPLSTLFLLLRVSGAYGLDGLVCLFPLALGVGEDCPNGLLP